MSEITRDIKRRVESIHRWFGRSVPIDNVTTTTAAAAAPTSIPPVSIAPQSSTLQQSVHDASLSNAKKPPPSSLDLDHNSSSTTPMIEQQQTRVVAATAPQHGTTKSSPQSQLKAPSPLGGTHPTDNDTILSLYDEHYRNVMFKCFEELQRDSSRKKEISLEILNDFKKGGGRFYKVEKGGNSYTEVGEKSALQSEFISI